VYVCVYVCVCVCVCVIGMGPIGVAEHLSPFLPGHVLVKSGGVHGIGVCVRVCERERERVCVCESMCVCVGVWYEYVCFVC